MCNRIRLEIAKAAPEAKCAPADMSFVWHFTQFNMQYEMMLVGTTRSYGKLPAPRLRQRFKGPENEERPGHMCARVAKSLPHRHTVICLRKPLI